MDNKQDLSQRIRDIVGTGGLSAKTSNLSQYHDQFRQSGIDKADGVLSILRKKSIDLAKVAYLSIGGSIGAEIGHILQNSDVRRGVLLEFDTSAVEEARKVAASLPKEKTLQIVPGDAMQKIAECRQIIEGWVEDEEIDCVVVSAQAVLHELPYRSKEFGLREFLSIALYPWKRVIFVGREPVRPEGWPEQVEMRVANLPSKSLYDLAQYIQQRLRFNGKVVRIGDWVSMPPDLAIETLTKLFYIEDFGYEIQESVTRLTSADLTAAIDGILGSYSVSSHAENSDSFDKNFRSYGVEVREGGDKSRNTMLPLPRAFFRYVADSASQVNSKIAPDPQVQPDIAFNTVGETNSVGQPTPEPVYHGLVEKLSATLYFDRWPTFIDSAVRNIIPIDFVKNAMALIRSVAEMNPGPFPSLDKLFEELAQKLTVYIAHFSENSEEIPGNQFYRENLDYKRSWNPDYTECLSLSGIWSLRNLVSLNEIVLTLNALQKELRLNLKLRLNSGERFAIVDSLGYYNDGESQSYFPTPDGLQELRQILLKKIEQHAVRFGKPSKFL